MGGFKKISENAIEGYTRRGNTLWSIIIGNGFEILSFKKKRTS